MQQVIIVNFENGKVPIFTFRIRQSTNLRFEVKVPISLLTVVRERGIGLKMTNQHDCFKSFGDCKAIVPLENATFEFFCFVPGNKITDALLSFLKTRDPAFFDDITKTKPPTNIWTRNQQSIWGDCASIFFFAHPDEPKPDIKPPRELDALHGAFWTRICS